MFLNCPKRALSLFLQLGCSPSVRPSARLAMFRWGLNRRSCDPTKCLAATASMKSLNRRKPAGHAPKILRFEQDWPSALQTLPDGGDSVNTSHFFPKSSEIGPDLRPRSGRLVKHSRPAYSRWSRTLAGPRRILKHEQATPVEPIRHHITDDTHDRRHRGRGHPRRTQRPPAVGPLAL